MLQNSIRKLQKKVIFTFIIFLMLCFPVPAQGEDWVLAAERFSINDYLENDSVALGTGEMFPSRILEKIGTNLHRDLLEDELLERARYDSKKERLSLYLQLSSEYKKRDSLVLGNYSSAELNKKLKENSSNIDKIKKNILKNIQTQKEKESNVKESIVNLNKDNKNTNSEANKFAVFFKNLTTDSKAVNNILDISFYQKDINALYVSDSKNKSYESYEFENEIVSRNISALLVGDIKFFGDFISLSVSVYLYPGHKKICTVTEVGTLDEADFIASSIADGILPYLKNSLPVELYFSIPEDKENKLQMYIDNRFYAEVPQKVIIDSGIHTIQFVSDLYKTEVLNYYFSGNEKYSVEPDFKLKEDGFMKIVFKNPVPGELYINGQFIENPKSQFKVNGQPVLGEFLNDEKQAMYFYIAAKDAQNKNVVEIRSKYRNPDEYIDKRRKWFYASYTALTLSLMPTFYVYGQFQNKAALYSAGKIGLEEAQQWQNAANITQGISIAMGVWLGYEIVRYLIAANSVLPETSKNLKDFDYEQINFIEIGEEDAEKTDEDKKSSSEINNIEE